jgi:predicted acetyltransferase
MSAITLRTPTEFDLPILAQMNKQMIKDEGSRNPMSLEQLEQRMRNFLNEGWTVDLLINEGNIAGYTLYQFQCDSYDPDQTVVYIRHFYIVRDQRQRGLGRQAIQVLRQNRFPANSTITLDVLSANPGGQAFWSSLGFEPYSTTLKLT